MVIYERCKLGRDNSSNRERDCVFVFRTHGSTRTTITEAGRVKGKGEEYERISGGPRHHHQNRQLANRLF